MQKIKYPFFMIAALLVAIVFIVFLVTGARSQEADLYFLRCSKISSECINFKFPNLLHCEIGLTPDQFCLPINEAD